MEVITLYQPKWEVSEKTFKWSLWLSYITTDGTIKSFSNTTEKNLTAMKQAVVNKFLKDGYKAPKNEIARYITRDDGHKLMMTKG